MCGRYTLVSKVDVIEKQFQATATFESYFNPNVSPGELAPVISSANPQQISLMQFGFQPPWSQKTILLINARSEGDHNPDDLAPYRGSMGIIHKPAFRRAIRSQRCLLLADAFVEGPKSEKLNKPFLVFPSHHPKPFAMAGLWESWQDPKSGRNMAGFAIITTPALAVVQQFGHHRSPLILPEAHYRSWLQHDLPLSEVSRMLYYEELPEFNAYPISTDIKSPKQKSINLLQALGAPIFPEQELQFTQNLKLYGMGTSPARERRSNADQQQLRFFE